MAELRVAVITCSDACASGECEDVLGRGIADACSDRGWDVVEYHVCPDDAECIVDSIVDAAAVGGAHVVLTCGGTGLDPRDVTPEATLLACDRQVPGIAEAIRAQLAAAGSRAMFSRGVAAQRGATLVVNLPDVEADAMPVLAMLLDQLEDTAGTLGGLGA